LSSPPQPAAAKRARRSAAKTAESERSMEASCGSSGRPSL
jgi:hypothetical protein